MKIKIVGIGGAGLKVLQEIEPSMEDPSIEKVGIDSDWQELEKKSFYQKVWLGTDGLRGLSAGGDPLVGEKAAYEAEKDLKAIFNETDLVFVIAGLGGGIGSGALPLLVKWAKEQGSKVIIIVSLPFIFEGERRTMLANTMLQQLKKENDFVFVFSCEDITKQGWQEGEKANDKLKKVQGAMASCVWGLIQLVTKKGLVFSDTAEVLKAIEVVSHSRCDEGGLAWSKGKGMRAIDMALAEISQGEWLKSSPGRVHEVLVAILGGPQLSLAEVKKITEFLKQSLGSESTRFVFNAILEEVNKGEIKLFVWTANSVLSENQIKNEVPDLVSSEVDLMIRSNGEEEAVAFSENEAFKQEAFAFEAPNRGRFEKTDATFYQGENLDTPTFSRKQIRIRYVVL